METHFQLLVVKQKVFLFFAYIITFILNIDSNTLLFLAIFIYIIQV